MCVEPFVSRKHSNAVFLYYKLPRYYDGKHRAIPSLVLIPLDGFISVLQVLIDSTPSCVITRVSFMWKCLATGDRCR